MDQQRFFEAEQAVSSALAAAQAAPVTTSFGDEKKPPKDIFWLKTRQVMIKNKSNYSCDNKF